jgi:hypothetical protein
MKKAVVHFSALLLFLLWTTAAHAQAAVRLAKVEPNSVRIGFQKGHLSSNTDGFKAGMWTPVFINLTEDEEGHILFPAAQDGSVSGEVFVETADNDGVFNVYSQRFTIAANEPLRILTYTKVAGSNPALRVSIKIGKRNFEIANQSYTQAVELGQHLYLALGDTLPDFRAALAKMAGDQAKDGDPNIRETRPRFAFYENAVQNLPDVWFGYESVDLLLLTTGNSKFLDKLTGDRQSSPQLQALADWVRRGGRLVLSIAPANREKVYRLLTSPAWQPALPPVLALDSKTLPLESLHELTNWSGAQNIPVNLGVDKKGQLQTHLGVHLQQPPTVSVLCKEPDAKGFAPLIVRFPYGTGSITMLAFDVKDQIFTNWEGQPQFWKAVIEKLAPDSGGPGGLNLNQIRFDMGQFDQRQDIASQLYTALEKFDTPTISFGWVVLFIFIYIIVVGPVDYVLLKLVFKRLELTWITFPAVVLTVSLLAYFTAYAIKGQDLKVNKIDLVDIDLRSGLGEDLQTISAKAYGTTWFSILSPRIQNYTIGIEPALHHWRESGVEPAVPIEPTLSWLGRPEYGGMGSGRGRSPGLFSRTYEFAPNATGLVGVPIPVWTTRSFTASWEAPLDRAKLPLEAKLTYEPGKRDSLSGTLKSNLPFDLHEVFLVQGQVYFPLANIAKGAEIQLHLKAGKDTALSTWVMATPAGQMPADPDASPGSAAFFRPNPVLRDIMFHEILDSKLQVRNHAYRTLDWSWRCEKNWWSSGETEEGRLKEVILVGRVAQVKGLLDRLQSDNDSRLATHLWLGALPGTPVTGKTRKVTGPDGKTEEVPVFEPRPSMQGSLVQETYIRVIIPVKPR